MKVLRAKDAPSQVPIPAVAGVVTKEATKSAIDKATNTSPTAINIPPLLRLQSNKPRHRYSDQ